MKYLKLLFSIIILFFFYSMPVYSHDKVAFVDIDFLIKNSTLGKNTLLKIDKLNTKNIENLKKKENILKDLENNINNKKNIISQDEFKKEVDLLRNKINDFKIEKNKMVTEFNKFKEKEINNLFKKINPIIENYMNTNSIKILLDRKNVFIGSVDSDLTNVLVKEINKDNN